MPIKDSGKVEKVVRKVEGFREQKEVSARCGEAEPVTPCGDSPAE
jgi:hypothetical protein